MLRALLALTIALPLLTAGAPHDSPRQGRPQTLAGRLGGDAQLEGGCDWLDDASARRPDEQRARYDPFWPKGYSVTFDPVRLWDPDGRLVAREGDVVRVRGRVRSDVMTVCQVGPVFEVSRIVSVSRGARRSG